ncbi:MAG: J domain-containing protein [Chloroflexi bacterium]|nr:J domain-containing protein [Chloroflexota bacterium]
MASDFYGVLGVKRNASRKEIRQAYRALARKYHPDVNPGNAAAEARFKEINRAYEVLSDAETRKKYDAYGDQWQHADQIEAMRRAEGARGRGGLGSFGDGGFRASGDPGDLGDLFGGGGRGFFDSLFGRAAGGGGRRRGRDVEHEVAITLEEAYAGTSRTLELRGGEERCVVCGGEGALAGATCHACRGSGVAAPQRRIQVNIPAGVDEGTRVRVAGRGAPGAGGATPGDLLLRVRVTPHPRFERRGADLHTEVDVPAWDAALGGEARVPTLKGKALALRIPAATPAGKVFRLAGQGMPKAGGGYGDLFAKVRLVLPERLTDEQRRLLEELRRASGAERAGAR